MWKVFNEEEEILLWSLKIDPGNIDTEKYVGYVDGIMKCKFHCIDWSTSRFESAYIAHKRAPREVIDNEKRPCEVKLFLKFWNSLF